MAEDADGILGSIVHWQRLDKDDQQLRFVDDLDAE